MIKINKSMEKVLKKLEDSNDEGHQLDNFIDILWPDFIEVDGCIIIKHDEDIENLNMNWIIEMFGDKTGFEATENHIHMVDICDEFIVNPKVGLRFAMKLIDIWGYKLMTSFPSYKFHLILTHDGEDSILRFYRYRQEEGDYLEDNLDEYENTCVMLKEFTVSSTIQ